MAKYFSSFVVAIMVLSGCTSDVKYFDVGLLPNEWYALTESDNGYVIYEYCEANTTVKLSKQEDYFLMEHYGSYDDFYCNIVHAYQTKEDTVILDVNWPMWDEGQSYKFIWVDKDRGLAKWTFVYDDYDETFLMVSKEHASEYKLVKVACDDYEEREEELALYEAKGRAIANIQIVFEEYMKATDSSIPRQEKETNSALMAQSLNEIMVPLDYPEYRLLLDVWMYYDPTGFETKNYVIKALSIDKRLAEKAILKRIVEKNENENPDEPPLSELKELLKLLATDNDEL